MEKKNGTTRIAKALTRREYLAGIHAGASGIPWHTYEERIRAATLDAPDGPAGKGVAGGKNGLDARAPRAKVISAEASEVAHRRDEIESELAEARSKHQALKKEYPALLGRRPASANAAFWVAVATLLLLGDWAFTTAALADAFGLDFQGGW